MHIPGLRNVQMATNSLNYMMSTSAVGLRQKSFENIATLLCNVLLTNLNCVENRILSIRQVCNSLVKLCDGNVFPSFMSAHDFFKSIKKNPT